MGELKKIYKKVNGTQQLKQYARAHVILFALVETAMLGLSKKSLEIVRLASSNRIYKKLKKKNKKLINEYIQNHLKDNLPRQVSDIIWICWLQGMAHAPKIVQKCYQSIKKNIKSKEIIIITEENYNDYVKFPNYIQEKYKNGIITKTHFSDLLRLELLAKYGGTWIDSTVFCSAPPKQDYILNSDLFLFQNLKPGLDGHCTSISNWFMTSGTNNPILLLTRHLMHNYWKTHNYIIDYFIFHMFFEMAIEAYPEEWNKVVPFSNSLPHILLLRLFDKYDEKMFEYIKELTCFHKLSYKFTDEQEMLNDTYYKYLISDGG